MSDIDSPLNSIKNIEGNPKILITIIVEREHDLSLLNEISKLFLYEKPVEVLLLFNNLSIDLQKFNSSSDKIRYINSEIVLPAGKLQKIVIEYAIQEEHFAVLIIELNKLPALIEKLELLLQDMQHHSELAFISISRKNKTTVGILNFMQKKVLGKELYNFFPCLVLYRVSHLKTIPFYYNDNSSFFQLDILIQLILKRAPFKEHVLKSYQVIPLKSKLKALFFLSKAFIHLTGILYQRKYDVIAENQHYSLKHNYTSSHSLAIKAVKSGSNVIEIGAGPFGISNFLVKKDCHAVTVDIFDIPNFSPNHKHLVADLDSEFKISLKGYDYVLLLDIIEHLKDPERFFRDISKQFGYHKQKLILTTANIGFLPIRIMLLLGYFNYGKSGILDRTHTRLFTFYSFLNLLRGYDLNIVKVRGIPAPFPKALGENFLSTLLLRINSFFIKIFRNLFSYQIYVEAETRPSAIWLSTKIKS